MTDTTDTKTALHDYALRWGDNGLILGQRLSEWTGHSPAVELDMAATNIALDLIGQAQHFLAYAGEVEGKGRSADQIAFLRDALQYRNFLLVEQPNRDFAHTIVRQYLFSSWHVLALEALTKSADRTLSEIAQKSVIEARYHESFARDWMVRLGDGTDESQARTQAGLDMLWQFTGEMFQMDGIDDMMLAEGIGIDAAALQEPWAAKVETACAEAFITCPEVGRMSLGGKRGHHTEHLGHLLSELQFMQRTYPGQEW